MKKSVRTFAKLAWTAGDVLSIPGEEGAKRMTIKQAERFLERNERLLSDRLTELGFQVMETLLKEERISAYKVGH